MKLVKALAIVAVSATPALAQVNDTDRSDYMSAISFDLNGDVFAKQEIDNHRR